MALSGIFRTPVSRKAGVAASVACLSLATLVRWCCFLPSLVISAYSDDTMLSSLKVVSQHGVERTIFRVASREPSPSTSPSSKNSIKRIPNSLSLGVNPCLISSSSSPHFHVFSSIFEHEDSSFRKHSPYTLKPELCTTWSWT